MNDDDDFLKRWSRRKLAAKTAPAEPAAQAIAPQAQIQSAPVAKTEEPVSEPLPPIESLTPESDFAAFMKPEVDPGLRREAMKVLMRDPRFNIMDGLDVYIDDYSKPDPLPPEWLGQMNQMKYLGHYIEKVLDAVEEKVAAAPEPLQESMTEQPVASLPETPAPDTGGDAKTPSQ